MFVQHSVHIDRPIEACALTLGQGPRRWFPRLRDKADYAVGPMLAGVPLRKRVTVTAGEPVKIGNHTEMPLTWKASFPAKVFPVMDGRVELAPLDGQVTRLTVSGMYAPPLGSVGAQLDQVLMHRLASATVKALVESIAKQLKAVAG